jgi:hypothetical protein
VLINDRPNQAGRSSLRARKIQVPGLLRRTLRRETVDGALDLLRLHLDTFPEGLYQPVDLPVRSAMRADGTTSRWEAMRPLLHELEIASAVDVGANAAYFAIELARTGVSVLAVDASAGQCRTAALAVRRSGVENVGVVHLDLHAETVALLPQVDAVLCLSVWHHIVAHRGMDAADRFLSELWARTGKVLVFDTGEGEMGPEFGLPNMAPDAGEWLRSYLAARCPGGCIEQLGRHRAFDAQGRDALRHLLAVVREVPL